jgi:hypothetical protein
MATGIDCVVVRNEFTASQDFSGAWRILHSIRELPATLAANEMAADDAMVTEAKPSQTSIGPSPTYTGT